MSPSNLTTSQIDKLKEYLDTLERLHAEKALIATDVTEVMKSARQQGFNAKAIQRLLQDRLAPEESTQLEATVAIYRSALGHLAGTPLGNSAEERQFGQVLQG